MTADRTSAANARLLCRTGEFAGLTVDVRDEITVGRETDNDVIVDSLLLSRRHARIFRDEGRWWIEDLESRNGTRVDGTAVEGAVPLERLSVITFADAADFVFVQAPGTGAEAAETGPAAGAEEPTTKADGPGERQATMVDQSPFAAVPDLEGDKDPGPGTRVDRSGFDAVPDLTEEPERPAASGPEDDESGRTRVDRAAFGAVPDLDAGAEDTPEEEASSATRDEEKGLPDPKPERKDVPEPGGTRLDMAAFDPVELQEESPAPEEESPGAEAESKAAEEPSGEQEAEDVPEPGGTRIDRAPFSMPDLHEDDPPPSSEPPPAESPTMMLDSTELAGPKVEVALVADLADGPTTFDLVPGDNVIGRASVCDIILPDPDKVLSRRHALVQVGEEGVTLTDLDSANGTFVGEERIESVSLEPGDSFKLGPYLQFTLVST